MEEFEGVEEDEGPEGVDGAVVLEGGGDGGEGVGDFGAGGGGEVGEGVVGTLTAGGGGEEGETAGGGGGRFGALGVRQFFINGIGIQRPEIRDKVISV